MITLDWPTGSNGSFVDPLNRWAQSTAGSADACRCEFDRSKTRGSASAIKFTLTGDGTTNTYRSELSGEGGATAPVGTNRGIVSGQNLWVAFALMCDPQTKLTRDNAEVLFQVHTLPGPYGYTNPVLSLVLRKNRLTLEHRYDNRLDPPDDTGIVVVAVADVGEIAPGVWTDMCLNVQVGRGVPGVTKLWRDDLLRYSNTSDPNSLNYTGTTHYLKFGCYATGWKSTPPPNGSADATRVWWFDQFRVGDASSSLTEISPAGKRIPQKVGLAVI